MQASNFYSVFTRYNALIAQLLDQVAHACGSGPRSAYVAFAQLKEGTGIERAFLCGALAMPSEALAALPSRAFATLVMGLQQQKIHESKVRALCPPKLLDLLRAGFEYTPELRALQARLHEDFDVAHVSAAAKM